MIRINLNIAIVAMVGPPVARAMSGRSGAACDSAPDTNSSFLDQPSLAAADEAIEVSIALPLTVSTYL